MYLPKLAVSMADLQRGSHPEGVACVGGFVGTTLEARLLAEKTPLHQ